jgi:hypothetical protein
MTPSGLANVILKSRYVSGSWVRSLFVSFIHHSKYVSAPPKKNSPGTRRSGRDSIKKTPYIVKLRYEKRFMCSSGYEEKARKILIIIAAASI